MDVAKLLQALEEILFEIACLAVLLPKTFFFLAFFPRRVYQYVGEELQKKPEERFDRFASPLILWSVTGIFPHYLVLSVFAANPTISKMMAANTDDMVLNLLALPAQTRFVALCAFAVSLPLAFAVVISREKEHQTAKSSLREPLYTLSYCTAPILLAAAPLWFFWEEQERGVHSGFVDLIPTYGTVLMFWAAWVGASLFRLHLGVAWGRALLLLGKAYLVLLGVMMLLEMAILLLVGTMGLAPKA
jgi:hypothetical protein